MYTKRLNTSWQTQNVWYGGVDQKAKEDQRCSTPVTVGFFIPVSSLKVFGHSIFSEKRRIYIWEINTSFTRMTPLSYHGYSVSGSSSQQSGGIHLKLFCLFSSILVHHKNFLRPLVIKVPINKELKTFSIKLLSNKIQAKTFTWPDMSFYAW